MRRSPDNPKKTCGILSIPYPYALRLLTHKVKGRNPMGLIQYTSP